MVENVTEEEVVETLEVSEEAQEEIDYDKEFNSQWGAAKESTEEVVVAESNEPTDADEPSEEVTGEEEIVIEAEGTAEETDDQANDDGTPVDNPDDPYAWINALPEEVRGQADALKHRALSDQGRVAAYNRRVADLQAELDRSNSRRASAPAAKAEEPSSAAPEMPEKFKQLKEDFPEFADAVEAVRELDRQAYRDELDAKLKPLEAERAVGRKAAFNDAVTAEAEKIFNTQETGTNWQDVVQGEDFSAWLSEQPQSVKNAASTPDPTEAVYVLRQYERDYQSAIAELESGQAEEEPVKKGTSTPAKADKVQSRRNQRQKESVGVSSKPIISDPNNEGGDYDAEFDRKWG